MNLRLQTTVWNGLRVGIGFSLILCGSNVRGNDQLPTAFLYRLTDLGPSDASSSRAYGVNSEGDVVLQSAEGSSAVTPCLWKASSQSATRLESAGGSAGYTYAVNSRGIVAGYVVGKVADHACLWERGKRIELSKDPHAFSQAYALNNAGAVVGVADLGDRYGRAFLWRHGKMTDLGTLSGGSSCAYGINDKDEVVGYSLTAYAGADFSYKAVLWQGGKTIDLGIYGIAHAVNNHGLIVGVRDYNDFHGQLIPIQPQAFSWQGGKATLLGTLEGKDSLAYAVNDTGEIVGASATSSKQFHAVLWRSGRPLDLNTTVFAPGWELAEAHGINMQGQIAGVGLFHGRQHGFLLTPISKLISSAPAAEVSETKDPHILSTSIDTAEEEVVRRRIDPVKVLFSNPVTLDGVECQTIAQAVWPLPTKNPKGNLAHNYVDIQKFKLAEYGQTNLFLAMRFTNRSDQPLYLRFSEPFMPRMEPNDPVRKNLRYHFSRPPHIDALFDSPLIAPGQSFTLSRTTRLAWYDDELEMECFSSDGMTTVSGLGSGLYSFQLSFSNRESVLRDSVYKTLEGSVELNKVKIEIR